MRILYLHGLHSKPGGIKPTYLAGLAHEVENPGMPDDDFAASVRIARDAFERSDPDVIVGSSRGGAVALNLGPVGGVPMVLIAPAWRKWGTAHSAPPGTVILHAPADAVIPFADSAALAPDGSGVRLIAVGRDHNMTDPDAFAALARAVAEARKV